MKPDEAHVWTDAELEKLERRIAAEYKKAAEELQDKIDAYFTSFAKRDAEQKALIGTVVNGKVYTNQDYQQWRRRWGTSARTTQFQHIVVVR